MRLLHVADRLSERGGAYVYLSGVLARLAPEHTLLLAVGETSPSLQSPCSVVSVPGLDARTDASTAVPGLDALAARFAPDAIHVHNVVNPAVLEWAARQGALVTVQDHRLFCPGRGKLTLRGEVCRQPLDAALCASCFDPPDGRYFHEVLTLTQARLGALRGCRAISVLSDYMRRELVQAGVAADRITVLPPFVHDLTPAPDAVVEPPCVLFVGRLVEAKGVLDAVAAWRQSGVALPLVFAGTGPLRQRLENAGLRVLGWTSRARLAGLYRAAHAVLMPCRWQEPFGIVGLESLAFGTPVVAWDSGGVREWHPGPGLVAWGDVAGLAAELREAVTRRAAPAASFDAERSMRLLLELYSGIRQARC